MGDQPKTLTAAEVLGAIDSLELMIEAGGDYVRARKLLETYGKSNPEMDAVNARLKDIPVDIAPVYVAAGEK